MEHSDVLTPTEEDTRVVLGMSATGSHDVEACGDVAAALAMKFRLNAVAVTLPVTLHNEFSAVMAAEGKTYRAPRHDVDPDVDRPSTSSDGGTHKA